MKYTVIIETSTSGYGEIEFHIQGLKDEGHIIPPPSSVSELIEVTTA